METKKREKWTLERCQQAASKRRGKVITAIIRSGKQAVEWECDKGHRWLNTPQHIEYRGQWCPVCFGRNSWTEEKASGLAASRGGSLIVGTYRGSRRKCQWMCGSNHIWSAEPHSIASGRWCPFCAGRVAWTVERAAGVAAARGGKLISEFVPSSSDPVEWMCHNGHRWMANVNGVDSRGTWCPFCVDDGTQLDACDSSERLRIERARKAAYEGHVKRCEQNSSLKITASVRGKLSVALRRDRSYWSKSVEAIVGCGFDDFINHIESQFSDGMSWENYGRRGWHIDHIRPCISFDLSDESQFFECFNFKNCQPLWWRDNLKKRAKWITQ